MHFLHERTEKAEIVVRRRSKGWAIRSAVHVRNIRSDSEMNGDGYPMFVGSGDNAGLRVLCFQNATRKELSRGFSVTDANSISEFCHLVQILSGFFRHAECTGYKPRFHILGSVPGKGDLEIVNQCRAVHRNAGNKAALHQVNKNGAKSDFNNVATDAPKNGAALFPRMMNGG